MRRTGARGRLACLDRRRQQLREALVAIRDRIGRLRRLERRDDVVLHRADKAQALPNLGQDLIPEWDLLRDLYGLLVYAGAAQEDRGRAMVHAHNVLAQVRARAWQGYADRPALPEEIRAGRPRGAAAHISYERHQPSLSQLRRSSPKALDLSVSARGPPHRSPPGQSRAGPRPRSALQVDRLAKRLPGAARLELLCHTVPELARKRDVVLLALALTLWGQGSWQGEAGELLALVRGGHLRLLEDPAAPLRGLRADRTPGSPHEALAAEIVTAAGDRRSGSGSGSGSGSKRSGQGSAPAEG